jgi:hypothetical protein
MTVFTIGGGAGFAGDRVDQAVKLAESGLVQAVALECLAERTLLPGLAARRVNPDAGYDTRLRRRLTPLLPPAWRQRCMVVTNLGVANPVAAGRATAALAAELGCRGMRIASIEGDDVMGAREAIAWDEPIEGKLLGAHAYLGAEALLPAVQDGADVVVTGRVADSGLFAAPLMPHLDGTATALAGALGVGHLLECSGQVTGGNYEPPGGPGLPGAELAHLGFPIARVMADGTAEIGLLPGAPGVVDRLTCTLQLLYEVHDPAAYITPDAILDFTGVIMEEVGPHRVRVSGVRHAGKPERLKVVGFVEAPGAIADVEIAYAGSDALGRGRRAAEALRERLRDWPDEDLRIDLVGVNSVLGGGSRSLAGELPEVRVHVSARCSDGEAAQVVEDEVYALTLSGPAGGGSVRSEKRARIEVVSGFIARDRAPTRVHWSEAA